MFEIYRYAHAAADACSPSTLQFSRHGGFLATQGRTLHDKLSQDLGFRT